MSHAIRKAVVTSTMALALAGTALAQTAVPPAVGDLRGRTNELLAAGRADAAYALLADRESEWLADRELSKLFGLAALTAGQLERAVMAFDRVLTQSPDDGDTRYGLAQAFFQMGSLDLAEQEFRRVATLNPPPAVREAIDRHLAEIARLRERQRFSWSARLESGLGHDDNISSTTANFSQAIDASFGFSGITPTGNSISRSATFGWLGGGASFLNRYAADRSWFGEATATARAYAGESDYNLGLIDLRLGHEWRLGEWNWLLGGFAQAYLQQGARRSVDNPLATRNDRDSYGANLELRRTISAYLQLAAGIQYAMFRYRENQTQDTDQTALSVSAILTPGAWPGGSMVFSAFASTDQARRDLNPLSGIDISRRSHGLRAAAHSDANALWSWQAGLSWTQRRDQDAHARAALIAHGRDDLYEATLQGRYDLGKGRALAPYVSHVTNRSNIPLYSFDKTEVGLAYHHEFD